MKQNGEVSRPPIKDMHNPSFGARLISAFERVVVIAVELLLMLAVAAAIVVLYVLFFSGAKTNLFAISSVSEMQVALQRAFAGVLLVMMGLELIETLKTYFAEHYVRIEVILIVAMIAVGRHIVQIDLEHMGGPALLGIAALMLGLASSYFLIKRTHGGTLVEKRVDERHPEP